MTWNSPLFSVGMKLIADSCCDFVTIFAPSLLVARPDAVKDYTPFRVN